MSDLTFNPRDPFPLLESEELIYEQAKQHARAADEWLGLETHRVEIEVRSRYRNLPDQELWLGLPVETLLTPYVEARLALECLGLEPGSTVVDLGAGYGRLGFVVARHHPTIRFVGYELVKERVDEGRRALERFVATLGSSAPEILASSATPSVKLVQADLADPAFRPLAAEAYFIYDYGSRSAVAKTLDDLRGIAAAGHPIAVVGRGRLVRDAIERTQPWLSEVVPPRHFASFSIYRSC